MPKEHRSRSRSPREHDGRSSKHRHRRRSRSPKRKREQLPLSTVAYTRPLPHKARQLTRHDLDSYRNLFSSYLDIQKNKVLEDLPDKELRGRWKSFMHKWNRRELPEGWYDPTTKTKADEALAEEAYHTRPASTKQASHEEQDSDRRSGAGSSDDGEDDDDDYGPAPAQGGPSQGHSHGASAPSFADLADRDAMLEDDHRDAMKARRHERKLERKQERERLDELAPRAEPGTKERQLEKKREAGASARAFREGHEAGGGVQEVNDSELMGGGEGGVADARRVRAEQERRRSEREIKREEALRARKAEREERLEVQRAKEKTTMDMLKAIAKERFG